MSDTPIHDNIDKPTPIYGHLTGDTPVVKPSTKPQPKVVAATAGASVGAALSVVLVWIVEASAHIDIPEAVELAVPVILCAGLAFLGGYYKKN